MDFQDNFLKSFGFAAAESKNSDQTHARKPADRSQTPGFNGCNIVVIEAVAGEKVYRGTGSLISTQNLDFINRVVGFEWILTAAHCVTVVDGGDVFFCDRLRARVPIYSKWDSVEDRSFNTKKPCELFEDIIIPVIENVTVFVYKKYFDFPTTHRGTDIALIRIPTTPRPHGLPFKLAGSSIGSVTVVGFPVTKDWHFYVPYLSNSTAVKVSPQKEKHATFQYMCDTSPGQSGGPVCADGVIVGIHSAAGTKSGNSGLLFTTPTYLWINGVCSEVEDRIYDDDGNILQEFLLEDSWDEDSICEDAISGDSETCNAAVSRNVKEETSDIIIHSISKNDAKKSDLVEHMFMLLNTLAATENAIASRVVLNENHVLQAKSLKCDVTDAFETLYKKDPKLSFQLSTSHELLEECFKRLNIATTYASDYIEPEIPSVPQASSEDRVILSQNSTEPDHELFNLETANKLKDDVEKYLVDTKRNLPRNEASHIIQLIFSFLIKTKADYKILKVTSNFHIIEGIYDVVDYFNDKPAYKARGKEAFLYFGRDKYDPSMNHWRFSPDHCANGWAASDRSYLNCATPDLCPGRWGKWNTEITHAVGVNPLELKPLPKMISAKLSLHSRSFQNNVYLIPVERSGNPQNLDNCPRIKVKMKFDDGTTLHCHQYAMKFYGGEWDLTGDPENLLQVSMNGGQLRGNWYPNNRAGKCRFGIKFRDAPDCSDYIDVEVV